jgi:hypothetical protein
MHEVDVARIAFGMERTLNDEWALVMPLDQTSTTKKRRVPVCQETRNVPINVPVKSQVEFRLPSGSAANGCIQEDQTVRC